MGEHDALLKRFQPVLRYDSNEQFFADSAAQYTDAPGITLRRGAPSREVIASAGGAGGVPKLSLDFLGPKVYGDDTPVEKTDVISVRGKDYREQYVALRMSRPDLNNVVYGHAIEANGRLWLQYWLWYFYNDYHLAFSFGTHEGDWEMVQLRMDTQAGHPDVAVYAQHGHGEARPWDEVEKLGDRPVVYVARGSHASYFDAGFHHTEAWYDVADGKRRMKHRPKLEILGTAEPAWTRWPGRWGDTVPSGPLDTDSPTGPGAKRYWKGPDKMLDNPPGVTQHSRGGPDAPDVRVSRAGGRLRVEYDVTKRDPRPHTLVVTVNSVDERDPPQTINLRVDASGQETVTTRVALDPLKRYDVHTSTVAGDPPVPSESTRSDIPAFGAQTPPLTLPQRVLQAISRTFAFIRGDRRGR